MFTPAPDYSTTSHEPTAERLLWLAILSQALHDARSNDPHVRHYARLLLAGDGVRIVAELAGIDTALLPILRNWTPPPPPPEPPKKPPRAHLVEIDGAMMPVSEAARCYGVDRDAVFSRLTRGWSTEQAVGLVDRPKTRGKALRALMRQEAEHRQSRNRPAST